MTEFGLASISDRLKRDFTELGRLNAGLYYLAELLRRSTKGKLRLIRYQFVAQPIAAAPIICKPDPATDVRLTQASDDTVRQFPRPPSVISRRYEANHLCLQIRVRGIFAGFLWLAFVAYDEDEVRCRYVLDDQETLAWDFDVYIDPQFRFGRTFVRLWDAANELLRSREIAWTLSRISVFNRGSLTSHARLGAVSLGYATFLCIGDLEIAFLPGRRFPTLSCGERGRPEIILRSP